MKKTFLSLLMLLGIFTTAYPQTLTCSCGSQASGTTIEYQIADPGTEEINCCRSVAVGVQNAYQFTWQAAGHGNYVLVAAHTYPTSAAAQADCCTDA